MRTAILTSISTEFHLKDKLFEYNETGEQLWYLDGKRFTTPTNGQDWPLEKMSADERRDPIANAFDDFTVTEFVHKNGATDAWTKFLVAEKGNLGRFNTLAFAGLASGLLVSTKTYGIRGANDQLPQAFATALGKHITYRAIVRRIDNQPGQGGPVRSARADTGDRPGPPGVGNNLPAFCRICRMGLGLFPDENAGSCAHGVGGTTCGDR